MRIRSLTACAVALTVVATAGLTGCSAGNQTVPGGDVALGTSNDINPQPREALRDGGNLRLATTEFPPNWNTLSNDGNNLEIARIVWPMMPRAFITDAGGRLSVDPDYFTDVRLTGTEPQQVTYTINPKAVWSDGTPITWEDIAAQANALSGRDKRYLIAVTSGFDRVEKVERGVDDRQAIITFKQHYAEWQGQFAGNSMLFPKSVTGNPESFNHGLVDHITETAGPFRVRSTDRTQGRIVLERNPKWWGETPKLDTITVSVLDQAAWPAALQNNELDAAQLFSISDLATVRTAAGLTIRHAPGTLWRHLTFNGSPGAILSDPKLRVAISKAIDRQTIVNAVSNGLENDPKPLGNHIYVRGQQGYRDNNPPFDPDAAARELDALGWRLEGDVRVKDGRRLEIRDVMYNNDVWVKVAQIIQQNLARIGVKLTIDARPGQNIFSDVFIPGDFDLAQFQWQGDAFPLSGVSQIYAYHPDDVQGNFGRIGSPELNELIDKTLSELDPQRAIELANEVDRAVFEEGFSLPLTQDPGNYGVRADIANFGAPGMASYDYTKIGFTK
ncbi:ABC transporter family substrate-binding protein [Nocardia wallacei]|uniref:ABC transporter family substrate-binding protein n=1 Tax=Nocardia wallacei TaxID=480035 RepID=UPI00245387D3|nr:ABC transporter family substrate-binding protein [Nocardia wallacei]